MPEGDVFATVRAENKRLQNKLLDGSISLSNDPFDRLVFQAYKRHRKKEHPNTTDHDIKGYSQQYITIAMDDNMPWFGTDSLEQWYENLNNERTKRLLHENGWLKADKSPVTIDYKFNKLGFRDEEHNYDDSEPCILCIGLSDIVGIGVHLEDTWPRLLGQAMGLKVYQMGASMGSLDTNRRLYDYWYDRLKPEYTFMSYSSSSKRFEIDGMPIGPWHKKEALRKLGVFDKYMNEDWKNARREKTMNYLRSEGIFLVTDKLTYEPYDEYDFLMDWYHNEYYPVQDPITREKPDFARDLIHPGPRWHRRLAETFLEKL